MIPTVEFLTKIKELCEKYNAVLILDEVQSGYGRSGYFFAHQEFGIEADIITTAKGMGNGFPIGGVLIHPNFRQAMVYWEQLWRKSFGLCSGNCCFRRDER
jgi:acetylornithine aminotransferase